MLHKCNVPSVEKRHCVHLGCMFFFLVIWVHGLIMFHPKQVVVFVLVSGFMDFNFSGGGS